MFLGLGATFGEEAGRLLGQPPARVIVVSADVQDSSRQIAVSAGASGFLNKPVDRAGLLATVEISRRKRKHV